MRYLIMVLGSTAALILYSAVSGAASYIGTMLLHSP
jgi:hypothetical protein